MKTINTWSDLGGHHQSGISYYKHLQSSKSATSNVNSPVCHCGIHFVSKLEWGPWQKATKLLVFSSDQPLRLFHHFDCIISCPWLPPLTKTIVVTIHGALWWNVEGKVCDCLARKCRDCLLMTSGMSRLLTKMRRNHTPTFNVPPQSSVYGWPQFFWSAVVGKDMIVTVSDCAITWDNFHVTCYLHNVNRHVQYFSRLLLYVLLWS